jgi:hypothetical protein
LFFLGKVSFTPPPKNGLPINPAVGSSDKAADHSSVSLIIDDRKGEALAASNILKRVITNQAQMPLCGQHFGFKGRHAPINGAYIGLNPPPFFQVLIQCLLKVAIVTHQEVAPPCLHLGKTAPQHNNVQSQKSHEDKGYNEKLAERLG